jgi:hypothetical protein
LTALGDQDVLIETNGRLVASGKRWAWMGAPGEVKWEEWMSTLTPLEPNSPFRTKVPEAKKEELCGPYVSQTTPDSEETAVEETNVEKKVGVESDEKGDVGAQVAK